MQCVILAAGKGTRMRPLTETTPKPLIPVCGKPILDYVIEALPAEVTEVILVTNYLEEQIKEYYGTEWNGRSIKYVTQDNPSGGTGAALMCAKDLVTEKFLFMYADDVHGASALEAVCQEEHAVLAMPTDEPEHFGILVLNDDGTLKEIVEKPAREAAPSNLANIGGWVMQPEIFSYEVAADEESGEVYVTDMLTAYAAEYAVKVIEQDVWIPIGNHDQLRQAEEILCGGGVDSEGEV